MLLTRASGRRSRASIVTPPPTGTKPTASSRADSLGLSLLWQDRLGDDNEPTTPWDFYIPIKGVRQQIEIVNNDWSDDQYNSTGKVLEPKITFMDQASALLQWAFTTGDIRGLQVIRHKTLCEYIQCEVPSTYRYLVLERQNI